MEEIFGLDMNYIMVAVLIGFALIVAGVGVVALLGRIILKIGLRNIPRRPAQTALIVVGLMLSTLIVSSALGTGDTLNHSIRNDVIKGLGEIDELLTENQGRSLGLTGSNPYFPVQRLHTLHDQLVDSDEIDGLIPMIAERAPVANLAKGTSVGLMNVIAVDAEELGVFGPIMASGGGPADPRALAGASVFINRVAADELDASDGDELQMFLQSGPVVLRVAMVVENGGLAGDDETMVLGLAQAQAIFEKPGQINSIVVSNRGDALGGVDLSEEVTKALRLLLTDAQVADELRQLLDEPPIVVAIREQAIGLPDRLKRDVLDVASLLESLESAEPKVQYDRLVSLLADDEVSAQLLLAVEAASDDPHVAQVSELFARLRILRVRDVKADLLDFANTVANGITSIFLIFGGFSMLSGVLLIFLIFVMLAAERKPEMGISRAVGMKRRHLVQSFVYEGLAYDLLSALLGALLGIAVSLALVTIMASIFAQEDEGFELVRQYRWQSFVVSYCVGVVLTFVTVFFSSYRAGRLNIVAAIRDLPDTGTASPRRARLRMVLAALARPLTHISRSFRAAARLNTAGFVGNLALAILRAIPIIWALDVAWALALALAPALAAGWLTLFLGVILAAWGLSIEQTAPYATGVTLAVIGAGLMLRWLYVRRRWAPPRQATATAGVVGGVCLFWLVVGIAQGQALTIWFALAVAGFETVRQAAMRRERVVTDAEDRNAFTFIGLTLILFWGTPFDALDWIVPELESNIEMFFISGVCMVAAAVWVVIYNADLVTNALTAVFGRVSRLRPSLKTAIAYPLNSRLRTGLTLAMLALVMFTLIVMSVITTAFGSAMDDVDSVTGGWDIVATVSYNNPIEDIHAELPLALDASAIDAVGGYTSLPIEARQIGEGSREWKRYTARGATQSYLDATGHDFALYAKEYGETKEEIWKALRDDPTLAVIDSVAVPSRSGGNFLIGGPRFKLEGFYMEDDYMPPTEIEIREPRTGTSARLTIIGVLDVVSDQFGVVMFNKSALDDISPVVLPLTTFRFSLAEDADANETAERLETAFLENGLESHILAEEIADQRRQNIALNRLLQGFMASGLLVGIAALGVISLRSVVERRQQIGVLRAIGYTRNMVLASFLMESSFIALMGIFIGVGLGVLLSVNMVSFLSEQVPGLKFSLPWLQLGLMVGVAYGFSLITTFLPARQASRLYPAQALRYE